MCPSRSSDMPPKCCNPQVPILSLAISAKPSTRLEQTTPSLKHAKKLAVADMSGVVQRQKLRAKTGCLTCKSRRKKCDEKTPVCDRCSLSGRSCTWPATTDLTDRRYASHPQSRYGNTTEPLLCLRSEKTSCDQVSFNLEVFLSRHFIEKYYNMLLLPGCRNEFYDGWLNEIQELMVDEKSLHYSMLTNAASHIYNTENSIEMQHLALSYYSKALRGLANIFSRPKSEHLANNNGLLMTVMLLYLHGCVGLGTYGDIPPHLTAAINILERRLLDVPTKITRPFDRLAVESVLLQLFLVNTGMWTEQSPTQSLPVDFWMQAEKLLEQSMLFPDQSESSNSPVLGIPASLYRLAIQAKQMLQHPQTVDRFTLDKLRNEVEMWEGVILCSRKEEQPLESNVDALREKYCGQTKLLFALIISLLSEQIAAIPNAHDSSLADEMNSGDKYAPSSALPDCWQVQKALEIIKGLQDDDGWLRCYVGNWPVYTIGFFLSDPEHVDIIRTDMKRRWELTKFTQIPRFLPDLEAIWALRCPSSPSPPSSVEEHTDSSSAASTP